MTIDVSAVPQALKDRPQWLVWRFETNKKKPDGKPLKVPYWVSGEKRKGTQGDAKDRAHLVTLDVAIAALDPSKPGAYSGVGFAFLPGDGLIGIDIDKCIDLDTGEISSMANGIIQACSSYTEYSPSGSGVHIIVAGACETFKSDKVGLEVFCSSQYFTFTGKPYAGMPAEVMPIADPVLNRLRTTVKGPRDKPKPLSAAGVAAGPSDERAKLESALAYVLPDDYDQWIRVGMAIFSTLGDSGFGVWDYWSQKSDKYAGSDDLKKHWKSFGTRGTQITAATIYKLATEEHWRPPKVPSNVVPITKASRKNPSPDGQQETAGGDPPSSDADEPGEGGGGKKKQVKRPQSFWDSVDHLMDHFVLLYGTNTAWDDVNRLQIKVPDLRLAFGSDAVKFWLGNGGRRMINADRLVFDPTRKVDPKTSVNMFNGFSVVPKKGKCEKVLDLLAHLCDGDQELVTWITRWIAYPLQHPGAKMETSIIMHGDEGSGKNLFWEKVVRRLYGEYGGVIGNAQIESQFNEWASQKLFFVADEVVTRNELKQLKGKLKNMVSGDEISINPKNLPERREANHMNFVFLSNELKPLELDKTDRRYLVVWTPPKKEPEYYKEVAGEAEAGGVEAFYHYLLHEVDCGDFNQHTKPIDTKAKSRLISLGLSPPERFYREWAAGALPLPFVCCSAMQLYAAFQRWSHLNGERFPPSQTEFGGKIERMAAGAVTRKVIKYEAGHVVKQRTAYVVGERPEGKPQQEWVEEASELFETFLKKYRHVYDQSEQQ